MHLQNIPEDLILQENFNAYRNNLAFEDKSLPLK